MKVLLTVISLIISFHIANACEPAEAQYMGEITEIRIVLNDSGETYCTAKVGKFTSYQESGVCPLSDSEVILLDLPDPECKMKPAQKVSGYIAVYLDGRIEW